MSDLDLPALGAQIDQGLQRLRASHEASERNVLQAIGTLRSAVAVNDRLAIAQAASELCDAEYDARGDCECFGPVAQLLVDAGLIPEDFDELHVEGGSGG